jgi:hypothetical protein
MFFGSNSQQDVYTSWEEGGTSKMPNLEEYTRVGTSKSWKKVLIIRFYWMSHSFGGYEHFLLQ